MRNRILMSLGVILAIIAFLGIANPASAQLSKVGPTLTQANAKSATQALLKYDTGVQNFLHISASASSSIQVTSAQYIKCRIGYSELCPFNTGKSGWKLVQTSYRKGQVREAFRITYTITINGKVVTKKVTFHKLSSNVLSGVKQIKSKRLVVNNGKSIEMRLRLSASASAKANNCAADVNAKSAAKVNNVVIKVMASSKGWAKVNATIKASASANVTIDCKQNTPSNPGSGCVSGSTNTNSGNQCATASQEAKQEVKVVPTCTAGDNVTNSCNTYINQYTYQTTYQFNCSKVTQINSSNGAVVSETWYAEDGSVTTEQICSSQYNNCTGQQNCNENPPPDCKDTNSCPPPPCKVDCEPHQDNAPDIMCVFPAHMYKTAGANVKIWCEAWDSDGDTVSINLVGDSYGHISGTTPSDVRWDNTACPSGRSCFKSTYWADRATPSGVNARITATVTAKGKSTSIIGEFPIYEDDFGTR